MKKDKIFLACFLLVALLLAYLALNTRGTFRFRERTDILNYNMLGEAILAGQLHLKQEVHPGRLSAADPADPTLPYPCIFDAIIFKGNYYFLQQPLPGLIHAFWIALTGFPLPTGVVVVLAAFGSLIWIGLILWRVRSLCFPESPEWIFWFCWMSFALSGAQLYMVSRPVVYHESIAVGVFFVLAGAAILMHIVVRPDAGSALFVLSGALLGAAAASRIPLILYPTCCAMCLTVYYLCYRQSFKTIISHNFLLLFPVAFFLSALLLYNFVRFEDWLDFGRRRVTVPSVQIYFHYIASMNSHWSLKNVPYILHWWLLSLPQVKWYLDMPALVYPTYTFQEGGVLLYRERVASIATMVPSLVLALPVPLLLYRAAKDHRLFFVMFLCATCSVVMFTFFLPFVNAIGRYLYEFTPLLFVLVFCTVAVLWQKLAANHRAQVATELALGILFALNCLAGVALGVNGMVQP